MLVLSRRLGERLLLGDDIAITVCRISGDNVRIGVDAPQSVQIRREELDGRVRKTPDVASPARDDPKPMPEPNRIPMIGEPYPIDTCAWTYNATSDLYATGCGAAWFATKSDVRRLDYCPKCGNARR